MGNTNLTRAKRAKNDEFYTQFGDIEKEMMAKSYDRCSISSPATTQTAIYTTQKPLFC